MTTRDVEKLSLQISKSKVNPEYYVSHAWLNDIENGKFTPSVFKFYSLSTIYHAGFAEILDYFGVNLADIGMDSLGIRMPRTHLLSGCALGTQEDIKLSARPAETSDLDQTKTLSRLPSEWHVLPLSVSRYLNTKDRILGYVGLQDFTLYPLVRPGSFVEINSRQNKIRAIPWTNEHDRPIYFVELRDRYVCSWCQLDDRQLSIVPHPISRQQIQRFKYPEEAEIVGRVTAVAMRLTSLEDE